MRDTQSIAVCTLGMHRSGTSLVSRMLNLLGVHLGPDDRIRTSSANNPRGYWEHRPIVDINDEILARLGGSWDEPPALADGWQRDPRLGDLKTRARRLLAEDFASELLWGWKDPRTCLTLPFWQDLVGPMRYVVCLRNPLAVMASLARRDGMPAARAERLWLLHMEAVLTNTSAEPRLIVSYEDVLDDWQGAARQLAAFTGTTERAANSEIQGEIRAFVEKEMCHHRPTMDDLAADPHVLFPTKAIYFALSDRLDLVGRLAVEEFDRSVAVTAARNDLDADLRRTTWERDDQRRQLQDILGSRAWKAVTLARKVTGRQ